MPSNRERLDQNVLSAQVHARNVITGSALNPAIPPISPPSLVEFQHFNVQALTDIAELYDIKRDQDRNIQRYVKICEDGTRSLVRDARDAKALSPEMEQMDHNSVRMTFIGGARAGLFILDNLPVNNATLKAKDQLYVLFNEYLQKDLRGMKKAEIKGAFIEYNDKILDIMRQNEIGGKNIKKDLQLAFHATNIHNQNYHISTISEFQGRVIVESDVMALGMTEKQVETMKNLIVRDQIGEPWFDAQTPMRKLMIRDIASSLFDDEGRVVKVMPTQLRTLMPLVKNAYLKVTSVMDAHKLVPIAENLHCGAIFFQTEDNPGREAELKEMGAQIASFTRGGRLNQVNSTSPQNKLNAAEGAAEQQSKHAMQVSGNVSSNTPFNILRKTSARDSTGYNETLKLLSEGIKISVDGLKGVSYLEGLANYMEHIADYISGNGQYDKAVKSIEALSEQLIKNQVNIRFVNALSAAVEAQKLLSAWTLQEITGNDSLKLFECFSLVNSAVHMPDGAIRKALLDVVRGNEELEAQVTKQLDQLPYLSFNCMSGKDRTGVAMFDATVVGVVDFVQSKLLEETPRYRPTDQELAAKEKWLNGDEVVQELGKVINRNGHTQQMPSQNNIGSHGVKSDSESAQALPVFKDNMLTRASASLNKFNVSELAKYPVTDAKEVDDLKLGYNMLAETMAKKSLQQASHESREQARRSVRDIRGIDPAH